MTKPPGSPARLVAMLCLLLLGACAPQSVQITRPPASIEGTLFVTGPGVTVNGRAAVSRQRIRPGDRVRTAIGTSALIEYPGGAWFQIDEGSDPVRFDWSGDRLRLSLDDATIRGSKGDTFSVIDIVMGLIEALITSEFVVDERFPVYARIDLFTGNARIVRPPGAATAIRGGQFFEIRDGRASVGRVTPARERALRARFERWDFDRRAGGGRPLILPDLRRTRLDRVRGELAERGIEVRVRGPGDGRSIVVDHRPGPGERVRPGDTVLLVTEREARPVRVPDLRGASLREARRAIREAGLEIAAIRGSTREDARIRQQSPPPGTRLEPGDGVTLVTEAPGERATVPDLTGRTVAEARRRVRQSGLALEVVGRTDGEARISRQSPEAGARARAGSTVRVVTREAERSVAVPDLRRLSLDRARERLKERGLEIGRIEGPTRGERVVIGQSPAAGTEVRRGSAVALRVRARAPEPEPEPERLRVPSVVGRSMPEAARLLSGRGFEVSQKGARGRSATVVAQDPPPRSSLPRGGRVTITGAEPIQ